MEDDGGGDEVVEGRGGEEEGDRDDRDEAHRHTTLQLPVPGRSGTNVSWEKTQEYYTGRITRNKILISQPHLGQRSTVDAVEIITT